MVLHAHLEDPVLLWRWWWCLVLAQSCLLQLPLFSRVHVNITQCFWTGDHCKHCVPGGLQQDRFLDSERRGCHAL